MPGDSIPNNSDKYKSQRLRWLLARNPKLVKVNLIDFKVAAAILLFVVLPLMLAGMLFETWMLEFVAISGHSLKPDAHALATGERMVAGSLSLITLGMAWMVIRMMSKLWGVYCQNPPPKGPTGGSGSRRQQPPPNNPTEGSGGSRVPRPPTNRPPVLTAAAGFPEDSEK